MSRTFIWEAGDAGQNIFRAEPEFTTFTASGLKAGLMGLGEVLHDVRPEKCILGLLNGATSRGKNKQDFKPIARSQQRSSASRVCSCSGF